MLIISPWSLGKRCHCVVSVHILNTREPSSLARCLFPLERGVTGVLSPRLLTKADGCSISPFLPLEHHGNRMTHLFVYLSVWVHKTLRVTQIAEPSVREGKGYSCLVAGKRKRENAAFSFKELQFNHNVNCIDLERGGGKLLPEASVVISRHSEQHLESPWQ